VITTCPHPAELARIGRGADAGSCPADLAAHIEDCPGCRQFLERCAAGGLDSLITPWAAGPREDGPPPRIEGFAIERELGRGAAGVVYLAHSDLPRRPVALKALPGGRRAGPQERRRWLREAEAAAAVRHRHIVTLYDAIVTDDWFVLALEYVAGGTLADRLAGPLAPRAAARLVEAIAGAVQHIHRSGLLHLDLKPSNILLDGDPGAGWGGVIPKVTDFGIARAAESAATDTGGAGPGGTPAYMAPEQISKTRREMTVQADIHGLGAILYHMLTGRPPYRGATVLETIDQVQRQEPEPPRRINPGVPRDLETICLKCLYKDQGRRYSSAEALAADLSRWLDGRPISARPVSAAEKSWRWCRRRPVIAALAAALMLTLWVSFVTVVVLWRRAEANFQVSVEMVGDLVDVVAGGEDGLPKAMTLDRLIPLLEHQRKHLLALSSSRPADLRVAYRLASVEGQLGTDLMRAGRHEEARSVSLDSLARQEELIRRHPKEANARPYLAWCCWRLAEVSERRGDAESCIAYLERGVQLWAEAIRLSPNASWFAMLIEFRSDLAWHHYWRGDRERAVSLLVTNEREVDNPPVGCDGQSVAVWRLLARIDLAELLPRAAPIDGREGGNHRSGSLAPLSRLMAPTDAKQSAGDWARLAAEALGCGDPDPHAAARREAEDTHLIMGLLAARASRLRRSRDVQGAGRVAERMLALADRVVANHPDEPAAYLALSSAYAQIYKNGYDTDDMPSIEANMKRAHDAAQKALLLDLGSEKARHAVDDLQRRLAKLRPDD
jgi:hypothetical protein